MSIAINLGDTLLQITREWKTAETWFLARLFIYQSSIVSKILDFIHWMVTILVLIAWLVKTENTSEFPTRIPSELFFSQNPSSGSLKAFHNLFYIIISAISKRIYLIALKYSLILRRPRSFAATSLPLSPSPVWYTLCEVVFMTSEPFVNFHQSERMYHILRRVECNPRFRVDCAKRFGVEKPFSKQFKALKTFAFFTACQRDSEIRLYFT